ncbi:hypothetical protein ABZ438_20660 [Streptomyces sp. NPDC005786]|uniref:hypothetical protein n=1 Tax=Streptomyces sp. NPDC005786 TaxID=3154891 RepID=UPI0033FB9021
MQSAVDDYTRPVGRPRSMTADLRGLCPHASDDQAVLRPLTRKRTAPPYERGPASPPAPWPPGSTQRDVRSAWAPAPGRTPSACPAA